MEPKRTEINHDDPNDTWNYRPWAQSSHGPFRVTSLADNARQFGDTTDLYEND